MKCSNCGEYLPDGALFCPECGKHIESDERKTRKKTFIIAGIGSIAAIFALYLIGVVVGMQYSASHRKPLDAGAVQVDDSSTRQILSENTLVHADTVNQKVQTESVSEKVKENTSKTGSSNSENLQDKSKKDSEKSVGNILKEAENAFPLMDNAMSNYIGTIFLSHDFSNMKKGDVFVLNLSNSEMIRAAVLASETDGVIDNYFREVNGETVMAQDAEPGPNGDGYHGQSVSKQSVEQNCRDLFGTEANWGELQNTVMCSVFDAVKYTDSSGTYAMLLDKEVETETNKASQKFRVREDDGHIIGEVDMFWGYWHRLSENPELSNYLITYELFPDNESKYGFIVTSIRIMKTEYDTVENNAKATENDIIKQSQTRPFYGVWCYASKDRDEAQKIADDLNALSLDGRIYISSEWSNLNSEMWYCVSSGSCETEGEAESVLKVVHNAGYADAYVKYSGAYLR